MTMNTPRIAACLWLALCFVGRSSSALQVSLAPLARQRSNQLISPSSSSTTTLRMSSDDGDENPREESNTSVNAKSVLGRILSPKIDDRGLPLSDVATAQIIGPALQVFTSTISQSPPPTWLRPILAGGWQYRGSLLAPTLIHGAALACCWLLGALAARAYENEAIDPTIKGYPTVLWRLFQAGCFASGILIFSTQVDLLLEFGRYVQWGDNPETDVRILNAAKDVVNDIVFEIIALVPSRLYLAASIARDSR